MPQYSNPLEALRKAQSIGADPRTRSMWGQQQYGLREPMPPLPPLPSSPRLRMPAPFEVPGLPPNDIPQGDDMEGITDAEAHWTSPEERSALGAKRGVSNYGPAFEGLRAAQSGQPGMSSMGPIEAPRRNQAAVEFYAKNLGLGSDMTNGSISQADLQSVYEQEQNRQDMMEMAKIQGPERQQRIQSGGELEKQREANRGQQQLQDTSPQSAYYRNLGNFLSPGAQTSSEGRRVTHAGPGGVSFGYAPQTSAALYGQLQKAKDVYAKTVGSSWNPLGSSGDPQLKAVVDKLERDLGIAPGGAPASEMGQGGGDAEMLAYAQENILNDPDVKDMPWEQLMPMLDPNFTPAQLAALRAVLTQARGGR